MDFKALKSNAGRMLPNLSLLLCYGFSCVINDKNHDPFPMTSLFNHLHVSRDWIIFAINQ